MKNFEPPTNKEVFGIIKNVKSLVAVHNGINAKLLKGNSSAYYKTIYTNFSSLFKDWRGAKGFERGKSETCLQRR